MFLIVIVVTLTLLQAWGFDVLNSEPNLAIVSIIATSFFISNVWEGLFLVSVSALILKFTPGLQLEILAFVLMGFFAVLVAKRLPWNYFLSSLLLITLTTSAFYLLFDRALFFSLVLAKELLFNLAVGVIIFALLHNLWENKLNSE